MLERTDFLITKDLTFFVLESVFDEKITLELLESRDIQEEFKEQAEYVFIEAAIIYLKLSNLQP